jgi:hypothetical protein
MTPLPFDEWYSQGVERSLTKPASTVELEGFMVQDFRFIKAFQALKPEVRRIIDAVAEPSVSLLIAGPICAESPKDSRKGVRLLGIVQDLAELYRQASVVIDPVLGGTGKSNKAVEALTLGWAMKKIRIGRRSFGCLLADETP